MTVYIEYVFLDNFFIDYMILSSAVYFSGARAEKKRIIVISLFGATISLLYPLIKNATLSFLFKLPIGIILVFLSCRYRTKKSFFRATVFFFFTTFLLGGAVFFIYQLFNIENSSELAVSIVLLPCYVVFRATFCIVHSIKRTELTKKDIFDCEITLGEKTVKCKGFYDSGNTATDGNDLVVITNGAFAKSLLDFSDLKYKYITVGTIFGEGRIFCFAIDSIKIYFNEEPNIFCNVILGVVKKKFGDYDVVLNSYFRGTNNETYKPVEKIS